MQIEDALVPYGNAPKPGIVSTLAIIVIGMIAFFGWVWAAHPGKASSITSQLNGSDYLLLSVFVLFGLIAATMVASMVQAFMRMMMILMQIGLLVVVAGAGVVIYRNYSSKSSARDYLPASAIHSRDRGYENRGQPTSVDPEERRRQLESELQTLDAKNGKTWWKK